MTRNTTSTIQRSVTVFSGLMAMAVSLAPVRAQATEPPVAEFEMYPVQSQIACMAANPQHPPKVYVKVKRGNKNDLMTVTLVGFKPGIKFDLFTIENSNQKANGAADPNFKNFGLAWYQTDLEPGVTTVKTILLDQIFGINQAVSPTPINTFHIGFWYNDPKDAQACNPNRQLIVTPFNGEHKAGPLAFVTRQISGRPAKLGPLCTKPNTSGTCDP